MGSWLNIPGHIADNIGDLGSEELERCISDQHHCGEQNTHFGGLDGAPVEQELEHGYHLLSVQDIWSACPAKKKQAPARMESIAGMVLRFRIIPASP